jgi:hypothetical protein
MEKQTIRHLLQRKNVSIERLVKRVIKDPRLVPELLDGLSADTAREKYGCAKVLRFVSERQPDILYPHFDFFAALLDSDNNFLKCDDARIIANLTVVDTKRRFEKIFEKYFSPIKGPVMITAATVIGMTPVIVCAKPQLTDRVVEEILKVEKARYKTVECRNIALGHAVKAFDRFFDRIGDKARVLRLVEKQRKNRRGSTRKTAEKFLRTHGVS